MRSRSALDKLVRPFTRMLEQPQLRCISVLWIAGFICTLMVISSPAFHGTPKTALESVLLARSVRLNAPHVGTSDDSAAREHFSGPPPGGQDDLSKALGWHEIPSTKLSQHCPSTKEIEGNTGCQAVLSAWNGGIADIKRQRLIFWGGGHSDYFGNEVYALDLKKLALERLTDPSPVSNVDSCPEAYTDGRPSARHTYNGLVYVPGQDAMFSFGGSKSSCGSMSDKIWKLDLASMQWTLMEPHRGDNFLYDPGISADYDPNTQAVFFSDTEHFFRYDPSTNSVKKLSELHGVDYHQSGVLDPERKLFFMIGFPNQFWVVEVGPHSKYDIHDWSKRVRGCDALLRAPAPGLAYEPVQRSVVSWVGGDSVYVFDPDRKTCQERSFPNGPGKAQEKGSFGRFRYFPSLGVFVIVNDWNQNAFVLRLTEASSMKSQSIVDTISP